MSKLIAAVGLMSGTSLDGIDAAFIRTDGEGLVERGPSRTFPYGGEQRELLRAALNAAVPLTGRWDRPAALADAEAALTAWHAEAALRFIAEENLRPDTVGFHGQTVLHRPEARLTIQLGDGPALAKALGLPVVFDMRAADVAAGGQGAPLVPAYHRALAAKVAARPAAFVNIGGVGNVTWIGAAGDLIAFDTGPGNALIDDWVKAKTGAARDENGALALSGRVDESAAAQFLGDGYFERPGPKSLDRNSFAGFSLGGLTPADGAATLAAITARCVAASARWFPSAPETWIICGGGRHNNAIMAALSALLPGVRKAEDHGFDGDAMEAEAWAYLAVRCRLGLPISFPATTRAPFPMTGGLIAHP